MSSLFGGPSLPPPPTSPTDNQESINRAAEEAKRKRLKSRVRTNFAGTLLTGDTAGGPQPNKKTNILGG